MAYLNPACRSYRVRRGIRARYRWSLAICGGRRFHWMKSGV